MELVHDERTYGDITNVDISEDKISDDYINDENIIDDDISMDDISVDDISEDGISVDGINDDLSNDERLSLVRIICMFPISHILLSDEKRHGRPNIRTHTPHCKSLARQHDESYSVFSRVLLSQYFQYSLLPGYCSAKQLPG